MLSEEERLHTFNEVWANLNPAPVRRLWPRIAAAASVILFLGIGTYFYVNRHSKHNEPQTVAQNDVAPGHVGATLTLADGKKIRLSAAANGTLASQSGVQITKAKDGQLVYEIKDNQNDPDQVNTLSTENGETYQVKLPDGTLVWLNAASSLTYKASINDQGKRKVRLTGEGYFEVAKDKAHPFIVSTATQEVEVLGTHFNINSYKDEAAVATTLIEGSVKVSTGNASKVIRPGEQATNSGGALKVAKANIETVTDWKDGDFNLEGLAFREAMRKIGRWYDVEIIYEANAPTDIETFGWVSRNNNLSTVLQLIERSGFVHFKVAGRKIYVSQ